jgi:hypothetical protein
MFVHDGIDTLIRDTSGLTYQQRIRKFIVTAYPKLVSGTYAGQKTVWPLLTRALNWVRAFTA